MLRIENVSKTFKRCSAVRNVSLSIERGETLAIIGESGSGKSTLGRLALGLEAPTQGAITFEGELLGKGNFKRLRRHMQMIFQDPYSSLNPRMTVESIVKEPLEIHGLGMQRERVEELLGLVQLPLHMTSRFPHELSGGERQRVAIARALCLNPSFIVCDEPLSSVDPAVGRCLADLFKALQQRLGLSYLFIAHDLSLVRKLASRVGVMYCGEIVEIGPVGEVLFRPKHPYTQALLDAELLLNPLEERKRRVVLLKGDPPSPFHLSPKGCSFYSRCPFAQERCGREKPILENGVACFYSTSAAQRNP